MGKYYQPPVVSGQSTSREIHPIWRGIGFLLIILTPILAYSGTLVLLQENSKNHWMTIPRDLIVQASDPLLLVKVVMTVGLSVLIYALFTFITFILYSIFGPSRYGPLDVPPIRAKTKRYRR
jgi:hypothetical protein